MTQASAIMPCPTCRREVALSGAARPATFPFCSPRCRTSDLAAWADGSHVIAGTPLSFDAYADDPGIDQMMDQMMDQVMDQKTDRS